MPKAGSGSIQRTLFNNSAMLEKNGFRYLSEWGRSHRGKLRHFFSSPPITPVDSSFGNPISKRRHKKDIRILTNKMLTVVGATECETLIISGEISELFSENAAIENLNEFIKENFYRNGIEITIVLMIRNPLLFAISLLQQTLFGSKYFRNIDFFDTIINHYEGIINLHRHFADSIVLVKFEDACLDKDGLVGHFLKKIGFLEKNIQALKIINSGEARCKEVMDLVNYIESIEPLALRNNFVSMNPNRTINDLRYIQKIKGAKFDLPYQSKIELFERLQKAVKILKENTGIDYTDYKVPLPSTEQETYSEKTIQELITAFPKLSPALQKLFLKFFEMQYAKTSQVKFKQLYFKDSVPWRIYNEKNIFLCGLAYRLKNMLPKLIPQSIRLTLKHKRGYADD